MSQAQAGGLRVPTTNTAGWGQVMAGGYCFPTIRAFTNNPAAMAFIDIADRPVDGHHADIDIKYNGDAYDYQVPRPAAGRGQPGTPEPRTNDGGQAGSARGCRPASWSYRSPTASPSV